MGMDHSGSKPMNPEMLRRLSEVQERFMRQMTGTDRREYPSGRMGAEDDGALAYAIASDDRHRTIVIRFPRPVEWIGLDMTAAEELRDQLTERLAALRGITAS